MAATNTTVTTLTITPVYMPVKSRFVTLVSRVKKKINFWWREGRRGGSTV